MAANERECCCARPAWWPPCLPAPEKDDDEASYYSAVGFESADAHVPAAPQSPLDAAADGWKADFGGLWRLVSHREDYDRWLALKVANGFKRRVAASLSATKRFVMDELPSGRIQHVYTLAGYLELTQLWHMGGADEWREETEAGLSCLISSSWEGRTLVIRKQFPSLGIVEEVQNALSADGAHLTATMRTTVVATQEVRATSDLFRRVG